MPHLIPALIAAYIGLLAAIPWAPRELGWYAADVGIHAAVWAPLPAAPKVAKNPAAAALSGPPISMSNLNRAHSATLALVVALLPYAVAVALAPRAYQPWQLAKDALRALA
jgi:hypothetical protein